STTWRSHISSPWPTTAPTAWRARRPTGRCRRAAVSATRATCRSSTSTATIAATGSPRAPRRSSCGRSAMNSSRRRDNAGQMTQRPATAIIGAGISGLAAGKNLADYGIPYTCFETSDRVGGNWAFRNPNGHSSAYRSLHIDTSKDLLSFKDYPMPADTPDFPHHSEIKAYLDELAEVFGLRERIEFENGVEPASHLNGGGWWLGTQEGGTRQLDVLVVANGHHWDPRYPDFPGEFDGETIHSHHYIDPTDPLDLRGKRVLVVGIGNSAADIVSELSQKSW